MQGKQKIIDGIIDTAKSTAKSMIADSEGEASARAEAVTGELDAKKQETDRAAEEAAKSAYSGRIKLGELEAGKIVLGAKHKCVCAVYDRVRELVLGMKDADYLAFLQRLVVENCADGDEVVAAQSDAKRVTAAWVKKVATAAKKKLTLSKDHGDFDGGVILRNAEYDRALTVDELIADLKDRTEAETVKVLGL